MPGGLEEEGSFLLKVGGQSAQKVSVLIWERVSRGLLLFKDCECGPDWLKVRLLKRKSAGGCCGSAGKQGGCGGLRVGPLRGCGIKRCLHFFCYRCGGAGGSCY